VAVADSRGREIDLHPVRSTPDGGGDQYLPDGCSFHHPAPVIGSIDGHDVRCVDVETQVACHLGYEPTDKDRHDLARLRDRFGVALPAVYEEPN
jgi:lincosamide nucleotidyltransferase A/C/D/E